MFLAGLLYLVLLASAAPAQEPLSAILQRGYIAHWLVCGPFASDAEGGVLGAVTAKAPALGTTDFMQPVGGMAGLRPQHLDTVKTAAGQATWQRAGANGAALDLKPFFPKEKEGIAYAGFYAQADAPAALLLTLDTPLGARAWVNGAQVRDAPGGTLEARGADSFAALLNAGMNFVVFEVPGADVDAMAEAAGTTPAAWRAMLAARGAALTGTSGFEIALRVKPLSRLGGIGFEPRLEPTGNFSGGAGDLMQETRFTLINPGAEPSPGIAASLSVPGRADPLVTKFPPLRPGETALARIPVPIGGVEAGKNVGVRVELTAGAASAGFDAQVPVLPHDSRAATFVVTGSLRRPNAEEDQAKATERAIGEIARQAALLEEEEHYGFQLGPAASWRAALDAAPGLRAGLRDAAARERCAAQAVYVPLDERLVGGETIARNLLYGTRAARALLGDARPAYFAWNGAGVAPQTPQLLAQAGVNGMVCDTPANGLPPLAYCVAPDGSRIAVRRIAERAGPGSIAELRAMADEARRAPSSLGVNLDVLPLRNAVDPPEPFWLGATGALLRAYPSIRVDGGGAYRYFDELSRLGDDVRGRIPAIARSLLTTGLGLVARHPDLMRAQALAEARVVIAERWATMASLLGAPYPEAALDAAWRQLLYASAQLQPGSAEIYLDTLAILRDAAEYADEVQRKATLYIASQADTLGKAPAKIEGVQALVVFNPSGATRDDVVESEVTFTAARGISLVDDTGAAVPFYADRLRLDAKRALGGARVAFVARAVPGMGYRTFYVGSEGTPPQASFRTDPMIQCDRLLVEIDPLSGQIARVQDKASGEVLAQGMLGGILGIPQDAAKTQGGVDLWSSGAPVEPGRPSDIATTVLPWMQRVAVTSPFAGGKLVREYTVYDGIDRIDCAVRVEAAQLPPGTLLAATFKTAEAGRAPIFGERFAAAIRRRSLGTLDFRTRGTDNPSGMALYPACDWVALSPNDSLRLGGGRVLPLAPAAIIAPADGALKGSAEAIMTALARRGIASSIWPDAPGVDEANRHDGSLQPNVEDDLDAGHSMRIVLGAPEQNRFGMALAKRLPAKAQQTLAERLAQGAALYAEDPKAPEGHAPVPTLILAAKDVAATARLAEEFARAVAQGADFTAPPSSVFGEQGAAPPEGGLAVFFPGVRLCSVERDGTLAMVLGAAGDPLAPAAPRMEWRFAVAPFAQSWREANVPLRAQAYNERLDAAQTALHSSRWPGALRMLGVDAPPLLLDAVYPYGEGLSGISARPRSAIDGIVVRGHDPGGKGWNGAVTLFTPIRDASSAGVLGQAAASIKTSGARFTADAPGFGIPSWWLLPDSRFARGPDTAIGRDADPYGALQAAYWQHRGGAAPLGNMPLAVAIEGALGADGGALRVVVANNLSDAALDGLLKLQAPAGWTVGPEQFAYSIAVGDVKTVEIALVRTPAAKGEAALAATTEYRGQTYRALRVLNPAPLEVKTARTLAQIKLTLNNPGTIPAEGYADLVAASAYWPELGDLPRVTVVPRRAAISIPPGGAQEILFRISDPNAPLNATLKIAANGHVQYVPVPAALSAMEPPPAASVPPGPRKANPNP